MAAKSRDLPKAKEVMHTSSSDQMDMVAKVVISYSEDTAFNMWR